MKNLLLVSALALVGAISLFGAPTKPLVTKFSGGGFIMPEYAGGERCEVFNDRVVITHTFGVNGPLAAQLAEVRTISLKGNFAAIIDAAKAEKEETKPNSMCDGPATSVSAYPTTGESVLLYTTGGCGSPRRSREGLASNKLRSIVDLYCPKTFDFSQEN